MPSMQFARAASDWIFSVPLDKLPWAKALLAAAIDEYPGDNMAALEAAKKEFAADPDGLDEFRYADGTGQEGASVGGGGEAAEGAAPPPTSLHSDPGTDLTEHFKALARDGLVRKDVP